MANSKKPIYLLGIALSHDRSACLLKDDRSLKTFTYNLHRRRTTRSARSLSDGRRNPDSDTVSFSDGDKHLSRKSADGAALRFRRVQRTWWLSVRSGGKSNSRAMIRCHI